MRSFMKTTFIIFVLLLISLSAYADENSRILIINSNKSVKKYKVVQKEFENSLRPVLKRQEIAEIDIQGRKLDDIDIETDEYRDMDLVYCIGAKAWTLANAHFSDKTIVFSSIINWLRIPISENTYGISNELHARMPIYMFRSVFPDIKQIGVMYSKQYTLEWFKDSEKLAGQLGIQLVGKMVSDKNQTMSTLKNLLPKVHALWLISDPLVMPKKKYLYDILKKADKAKKPVFTYHEAFAKIGAVLAVSADNPTIGRQAAEMALELISGGTLDDEVQFPAGSHITLNMNKVQSYNLNLNKNSLSLVNTIIK